MAKTPYLMQTGMGVDLHGANDTRAARRAVEAAIGHNSLLFLRQLRQQGGGKVQVEVTVACPHPERVDTEAVRAALPVGEVSVQAASGGLLVETGVSGDPILIAVAAVLVSVEEA